jgi:hypothetical protein
MDSPYIKIEGPYLAAGDLPGGERSLYYHFPSMEMLDNGEIILCCKEIKNGIHDPKGRILMFRSNDSGMTWSPGIPPTCHDEIQHPEKGYLFAHVTETGPGELLSVYSIIDTDETKPLFNPEGDGMQNAHVRTARSRDGGLSWENPKEIEFTSRDIIVPSKIIKLPDGSLGFPCEMHDHWEGGYKEGNKSIFIKSYDRGATFPEAKVIGADRGILYGDARPTFVEERLMVFLWTLDLKAMKDLQIHRSYSADSGETWSKPMAVNITTQIMSPIYFRDGLMLAVHQDRFSDNPGLKAVLSFDNGFNWDKSTEVTVFGAGSRPDGTNPFAQLDQFEFGYSSLLKTGEAGALVSFWHTNGKTTSISTAQITIKDR